MQGYFLPPVSFTPDEANALLLLETLGATLADGSIQPHVAAASRTQQPSCWPGGRRESCWA